MSQPTPEGMLEFVRGMVLRIKPGYVRSVDRDLMAQLPAPAPWTPAEWVLEGIPGSAYEFTHRTCQHNGHTIFQRRHTPARNDLRTYVSADRTHLYTQRPSDLLFEPKNHEPTNPDPAN